MSTSDPPTRLPFAATATKYRVVLSFVIHAALFALALFSAFGMYFNFRGFNRWFWPFFVPMLPIVLVLKLFVFTRMRLLLRGWRYFGMRDLIAVIKATWLTTAGFILVSFAIEYYYQIFGDRGDSFLFVYLRDEAGKLVFVRDESGTLLLDKAGELIRQVKYQFPQSAFVLDWGLTIAAVCGVRVLARLYMEETRPVASGGLTQCLIVGAGDTGEALLREILRMSVERYRVIGFLDDDPTRKGVRIHDVPVLGRTDQARTICEKHDIQEILIADRKLRQKALRRIVEQCEGTHVRFQTIPAMEEVIAGRVRVSQVREVDIKDILGRAQVQLDEPGLQTFLHGKRVFVTGAGGSIGSEICRQVSSFRPSCLILIEQAENNLFQIDRELERLAPDVPRVRAIADVCDAVRIDGLFAEHEPDVVFHAAAHKHVPMMEWNVGEAIKNNIKGTKTVADAAKRHNTGRFVMISTDKAVNPTSVMGCTKRVTEMYIQQLRQGAETEFMTVRFGNVLGSSGSVVPIFTRQIAAGGPVTVTHPDMTRYFMTIPEATQLVLQAGVIGTDGDIFVLDMGEPVKIVDLAREMITLSGLRPGEDIEIEFTGIRPGEKLFEELSVQGEDMSPTRHEQIYIWRNRAEDWHRIRRAVDDIIDLADRTTQDALRARLAEIVPEYVGHRHGEPATDRPPMQAESGSATIAPSAKDCR